MRHLQIALSMGGAGKAVTGITDAGAAFAGELDFLVRPPRRGFLWYREQDLNLHALAGTGS